jgi:excisionase family DNA binding protein
LRPSVRGKRLASIDDAAEYGDVSTKTIRRRIADGTITGYRLGPRLLRVDLNEVDEKLLQCIPTAG